MAEKRNYAGFYPRMLAHNIDLIVLLPFFYLIGYFVSQNLLLIVLCILFYILYYTIFEASTWKATPGKRIQKITVELDSNHEQSDLLPILIRNSSKVLSAALFFAGFILVAFDKKKRALHDRIAGTLVIFREK